MQSDNPTALARRRYRNSFTLAMVAYVILVFAAALYDKHTHPAAALRIVLYLVPLVPIGFMVPAVVRYLHDTDELERRVVTDSLAVAGAVTALLSATYGFLEIAGLPHLSAWWTWMVVMGSWGLARCFIGRRYQ